MPGYGRYRNIRDYLETRARELDTNITQLSYDMFDKRTYLSAIASEQFRPSMERCREIADHLGDDPEIMLTLAGYMEPPPEECRVSAAIARTADTLPPDLQRMVLQMTEFLRDQGLSRATEKLDPNQIYIELPDGRSIILDLDAPTDQVSESLLRVSVRAALNATLNRTHA